MSEFYNQELDQDLVNEQEKEGVGLRSQKIVILGVIAVLAVALVLVPVVTLSTQAKQAKQAKQASDYAAYQKQIRDIFAPPEQKSVKQLEREGYFDQSGALAPRAPKSLYPRWNKYRETLREWAGQPWTRSAARSSYAQEMARDVCRQFRTIGVNKTINAWAASDLSAEQAASVLYGAAHYVCYGWEDRFMRVADPGYTP